MESNGGKNTSYRTIQAPVLFLVFNRPETTARVFEAIRNAQPARLYVAADGPRECRVGESKLTNEVRRIVSNVDWQCDLRLLFRQENLGCKRAISSAISWFFSLEERGIILEDDCLPGESFFWFCDSLLERYENDSRIWAINGTNFQDGEKRGDGSYYFSIYQHIWGWATWRRVWATYDVQMRFWRNWRYSEDWQAFFKKRTMRRYWTLIFDSTYAGKIDTWDYQFVANTFFHKGLVATPNINLVSNIGFGANATHANHSNSRLANRDISSFEELIHPEVVEANEDADNYDFENVFRGSRYRFLRSLLVFLKMWLSDVSRLIRNI